MSRRNLSEYIEMDILLRLPVKSLLRFRCVSKHWCARFQNPHFITNHYLKQTSNNNDYANVSVLALRIDRQPDAQNSDIPFFTLLDNDTLSVKENIYLPFPVDYTHDEPRVMACNGLICLWYHNQITLWNPATREFKHLPESHIQRPPHTFETVLNASGFGFDSKTDDYKVICILHNHIENQMYPQIIFSVQIDLYTMSTDSWREIQAPGHLVLANPNFNTYMNGVFHWESPVAECIIAFDMADELFSTLPLPNLCSNYRGWYVGVLNGSLVIYNFPNVGMEINIDIWVMKEYGVTESWTKLLTIGPIFGSYMPLEFWKNDRLFLRSLPDDQLVLYDPNTHEIEKLQVYCRLNCRPMWVIIHVGSLVPINERREHEDERFIRLPPQMGDA